MSTIPLTSFRQRFSLFPVTSSEVRLPPEPNFLSQTNIPAGGTVMLRGFSLSTIEAALTLTVGRGGRFSQQGVLTRYHPSGREPDCIIIRGRSGRPMLANSGERFETGRFSTADSHFWEPYQQQLQQLQQLHSRHQKPLQCQDIWPILSQAAAGLLTTHAQPTSASQVEHWFRGWSRYRMTRVASARALLQSYAVAIGARPIDIPAALGEVWRKLLIELLPILRSDEGRSETASHCQRLTREMERIAGGPPAEKTAKLLGLMRRRLVATACEGDSLAEVLRWAEVGATAHR